MNQSVNLWQPLHCFELDSNGHYDDVTVEVCHTVFCYAIYIRLHIFTQLLVSRNALSCLYDKETE